MSVKHTSTDLCDNCSKISVAAYFQQATHCREIDGQAEPSEDALYLGTLEEILSRSEFCHLCTLVVEALKNTFPYDKLGLHSLLARLRSDKIASDCWLYSYHFFKDTPDATGAATKTFRLAVSTLHPSKGAELYRFALRHHAGDIQILTESAEILGLPNAFHGRNMKPDCVDVNLAKQWLQMCERVHGSLCEQPGLDRRGLFAVQPPNGTKVIDVTRRCVTALPQGARYVTLSYCWPSAPGLVATKANQDSLMIDGALDQHANLLSQTIQDAIQFTRDLDESHLWIDSLCIVQDDPNDKRHQISQMDLIYGSAVLTIVAAHNKGDDTAGGLPGYRKASRLSRQKMITVQGLELAVPLPCLEDLLTRTRWDTRGWTFQETMLSRRLLYFTDAQAYFQCSCGICCEDSVGEYHDPAAYVAITTNLWNPKNLYNADPDRNYGELSIVHSRYSLESEALGAYNTFVSYYLRRELSFTEDVLNAFDGLLHIFERSMVTKFWYGLPEKWFDHALLWQFAGPAKRRTKHGRPISIATSGSHDFPSWSWTGWETVSEASYWLMLEDVRPLLDWYVILISGTVGRLLPTRTLPELVAGYTPALTTATNELSSAACSHQDLEAAMASEDRMLCLATYTATQNLYLDATAYWQTNAGDDIWPDGVHLKILNNEGSWIGLILVDRVWIRDHISGRQTFPFMVLSEAARARPEDTDAFDTTAYAKKEWCLLNVIDAGRTDWRVCSKIGCWGRAQGCLE